MDNNHYYSKNQDGLKSEESTFDFYFKDQKFTFTTDNGVFSKNYIDFGSYTMLKSFVLSAPGTILDMGSGYGPIGIILGKLNNTHVVMAEINSRALALANKNIIANGCSDLVSAISSDTFDNIASEQMFSYVISNPPIRAGKDICQKIYKGAYEHLLSNGELWIVIQKKQGAPSTKEFLTNLFGNCEIINREKGYFILRSKKIIDNESRL